MRKMDLIANWLNNEIELEKVSPSCTRTSNSNDRSSKTSKKILRTATCSPTCFSSSNSSATSRSFQKSKHRSLTPSRTSQESKIANFVKLEPVFKNLKIKFDSNLADDIIKQKKGIALRVLYQLRMALEKVYPPTDISVLRKSDMQPAKKIVPAREAYDNQTSGHFKLRLQEKNRAQKNINLD